MIQDIIERLKTINIVNGYAVAPRDVVKITDAEERNALPQRTIAVLQDTERCCGIFIVLSPGADVTCAALRQSIAAVLADHYEVDAQSDSLPLLVCEFDQPPTNDGESDDDSVQTIADDRRED